MRKSLFSMQSLLIDGAVPRPGTQDSANLIGQRSPNSLKPLETAQSFRFPSPQSTEPFDFLLSLPTQPSSHKKTFQEILLSKDRTDDEAWTLYDHIKDYKFFSQLKGGNDDNQKTMDTFLHICKKLCYESHPSGSIIMHQGEYSNGLVYIVLSGELSVFIQGLNIPSPSMAQTTQILPAGKDVSIKITSIIIDQSFNGESSSPVGSRNLLAPDGFERSDRAVSPKNPKKGGKRSSTFVASLEGIKLIGEETKSSKDEILSPNKKRMSISKSHTHNFLARGEPSMRSLLNLMGTPREKQVIKIERHDTNGSIDPHNTSENKAETPKRLRRAGQQTEIPDLDDSLTEQYGTLVNKIPAGSYFGEKAVFKLHKRNATIVAHSDVEFLTLTQQEFQRLQGEFNKMRAMTLRFLRDIFPNVDSVHAPSVLENLIYNSEIKVFTYKRAITLEGEPGEDFFVVFEGQCEFSKTVIYDESHKYNFPVSDKKSLYGLTRTKKETIVVANVERGTFIGEEILFREKGSYEYTVRAMTEKVKLFAFKKSRFTFKCPKPILKGLQDLFTTKKDKYGQILQEKLQKKGGASLSPNVSLNSLDGAKSVVTIQKSPNNSLAGIPMSQLAVKRSVTPIDSNRSIRYSIRIDESSTKRPATDIGSFAGIEPRRSFRIPDLENKEVSTLNSLNVGSPINQNRRTSFLPDTFLFDKGSPKNDDQVRTKTETFHNSIQTSGKSSPSSKAFVKGISPIFTRQNSSEKIPKVMIYSPGKEDPYPLSITVHSPIIKPRPSFVRPTLITNPDSTDMSTREPIKLKEEDFLNSPGKNSKGKEKVASQWRLGKKSRGDKGGKGEKSPDKSPDFLTLLQLRKDTIMKKKQKSNNKFSQNSIEMSWKMSETASVISFGTPTVESGSTRILTSRHKKLAGVLNIDMDKNLIKVKSRKKKTKKEIEEAIRILAMPKQSRAKSMQVTKRIDMNLQFYSGFKPDKLASLY